jgi:heptosyltransferase-2
MRALVIQTAFIGDAVLTLPMISKLKELYEDIVIDVVCAPFTAEIFASSGAVNNVFVMDKRGKHKSIFALYKFAKLLSAEKYDRIYSPHRSFRTSLFVLFTGVKETYGFSNSSFNYVYRNIVNYDGNIHEVKRNFSLIGFYPGEGFADMLPELNFSDAVKRKVENFKKENVKGKYIVIAPSSVWKTKEYPAEYFKKIADYFSRRGYSVILMGSEKDSFRLKEYLTYNDKLILAAGLFTLVESVELLRGAELLISNDSAPAHLGLCANIPALMLYCSTVPGFGFYPYSAKSAYLEVDGLSCRPCGIHGKTECPLGTFDCGYKLTPEQVIKKAEELLNG